MQPPPPLVHGPQAEWQSLHPHAYHLLTGLLSTHPHPLVSLPITLQDPALQPPSCIHPPPPLPGCSVLTSRSPIWLTREDCRAGEDEETSSSLLPAYFFIQIVTHGKFRKQQFAFEIQFVFIPTFVKPASFSSPQRPQPQESAAPPQITASWGPSSKLPHYSNATQGLVAISRGCYCSYFTPSVT